MNSHDDAVFYELAASEIAAGKPDRGLFAKAYSVALGQEEKTKAIYIQYRAEQLKEAAVRRAEDEAKKSSGGRKAYLTDLKEEFGFLSRYSIPASEVSSAQFSGDRRSLLSPKKLADVSEALGLLEFKLIDAVKAGLISGVRDSDDEWWISKKTG